MTPFWIFICVLLALIAVAYILYHYYPVIQAIPHKEYILFVLLAIVGAIVAAYHMMPDSRPMDKYQGESAGVRVPELWYSKGCG